MYPSTIHRILKKYHESGYTNDLTTEELVNTSKSDTNIDSNESDPTNLNDLDEQIFLKAAIHVKQTIDQRKLANSKIAEAKNTNCSASLTTLQTELVQTIIVNYCQTLNLPHLGNEQPGNVYYFSPLSIICLEYAIQLLAAYTHMSIMSPRALKVK